MADEIEIGSKAIKQIQDLRAELIKLSQDVMNVNKNTINITTPGGLNKSVNDNARTGAELDALKAKYVSLSETIAKKAEQSRLAEIRLQQQREKSFDSFEKNAKKEEAALIKAEGAYQRIQNSVNLLTKTYNDLAIRKELGNTLTAKEEKQLTSLSARINQYQTALKATDAQIGKNQRNVGNYEIGYNALGNSINQLTREAPAFANSMQTGFMALSNNFAALEDAIRGIRAQNSALAAEGKPTVSVLKQLGGAFFSWTTLISVGVTLLTIYGAKLVDMAMGLGDVESALKKVEAQQKRNNAALEQANKNIDHNLILEKNRLKQLGASDAELKRLDKEAAKRKLQNFETTRDINKKIYEDEAKNVLNKKGLSTDYIDFDFKSFKQLSETRKKIDDELIKRGLYVQNRGYVAKTKEDQKYIDNFNKINSEWYKQNIVAETLSGNEILNKKRENFTKAENEVKNYGQTVSEINSNINSETEKVDKKAEKAEKDRLADKHARQLSDLELEKRNAQQLVDTYRGVAEKRALYSIQLAEIENRITKTKYNEEIRLANGNSDLLKIAANNQIIALEETKTSNLVRIRDFYDEMFLEVAKVAETLKPKDGGDETTDPLFVKMIVGTLEDQNKTTEKAKEYVKKTAEELKNYIGSFGEEFMGNSGFSETFNNLFKFDENGNNFFQQIDDSLLSSEEKFAAYFNGISEMAQEAFNFISNVSQQNFDNEKSRLQSQYDIALTYAGENKAAQEKLAQDLEKQKKDIANRENKAKQKQAIFNIAIDTAQGIISALASTPPNVPLSIFIGALGAAQIAMVASQKIPQYWMGGTHDGGLMMVNDGTGSNYKETIVTPDGNIHKPQGKNVIMNAPAGTEIFTHDQWNEQMNNMLQGNGINWSLPQHQSSGISKADMRDAMLEAIGEQPQYHSNFDANGATTYIMKKGNITRSASNRGNSIKTRFS